MKIRGITVGTPIKPEKNLVKATDLTEEEKAQARENIGAVGADGSGILDEAILMQKMEGVSAITNLLCGTYTNKVMSADGITMADNNYHRLWDNEIPCKQGDILYRYNTGGISFICEYDTNGTPLNNGGDYRYPIAAGVASTTIKHKNAAYIRICEQAAVAEGQVWSITPVSQYIEGGEALYDFARNPMYADVIGRTLPLAGKKIVNFGDSIFGNTRDTNNTTDKSISTMLAEKTGATVYNAGFGGCRMTTSELSFTAFSMVQLANSIVSGDWSAQDGVIALNLDYVPSYFAETVEMLKGIDFADIDIATIAYGTNDFTSGSGIDNSENPYDTTTICGALRYSVEQLQTAYPNLRIFVLLPTWRFWKDGNNVFTEDSNTHIENGHTLSEFSNALVSVAEEYQLPVIDNYKELGINKFNRAMYFPTNASGVVTDGSHHNANGRELIAGHIAKNLF